MKLKLTLCASIFTILAGFSHGIGAAADAAHNAGAAAGTQADTKVEKTARPKIVRPHSHVEEKTGFPQPKAETAPDKQNAAKDRSKHIHPRDGK